MQSNLRRQIWIMLLATLAPSLAWTQKIMLAPTEAENSNVHPVETISLSSLGYLPPGMIPALESATLVTLDFIDGNHLLFSFNALGLAQRTDGCASGGYARWLHTVVLNIATGKVEKEARWELFDYSPYLQSLQNGQFLLRRCSQISVFDAELEPKPFLNVEGSVLMMNLSPDGSYMLLESQRSQQSSQADSRHDSKHSSNGTPLQSLPIDLNFLRVTPLDVLAHAHATAMESLPLFDTGFLTMQTTQRGLWAVSLQSYNQKGLHQPVPPVLTKIHSTCTPQIKAISSKSFLAVVCLDAAGAMVQDQAYDLSGRLLWQQPVSQNHLSPHSMVSTAAYILSSMDQSKVAIETIHTAHAIPLANQIDAGSSSSMDEQTGLTVSNTILLPGQTVSNTSFLQASDDIDGQKIDVYEASTGKPVFHFITNPIYSAGQNFALSPDGKRFAVLHDGAIEIYLLDQSIEKIQTSQP